MRLPTAPLVLATIAMALFGAEATLETICKTVSNNDAAVNYDFCVKQLASHPWAHGIDPKGLAMQAADLGVGNAYRAIQDMEGLLAKPESDAKTREALGQCDGLYISMRFAFAYAHHWINNGNYTAGKEEVGNAISLGHQCDEVFAKVGVPSPLTERSSYSSQIAMVCTAIINLIQ
jgi:pectinesterase inhibitor-like protein